MKYLVESVKKRVSKGNGDAARRAETWRGRYEKRKAAWKDEASTRSAAETHRHALGHL